jgi:IMP dehydrogenase
MIANECLSYRDVLLVPTKPSSVKSRRDVDTSVTLRMGLDFPKLDIPLVSAPMPSINRPEFFRELRELGGIGCVHRFQPVSHQLDQAGEPGSTIISIGLDDFNRYEAAYKTGHRAFLVDIANGYHPDLEELARRLTEDFSDFILGNYCDGTGYQIAVDMGAGAVRVGVGTGHACTTRDVTGVGMPIVDAIETSYSIKTELERCDEGPASSIIADGGVRKPADLAKALWFGADAIMIGKMFAETVESSGEVGQKVYRGAASFEVQSENGQDAEAIMVEGVSMPIVADTTLERVVKSFRDGLRSAMSYLGAHTLEEFRDTGDYCVDRSHSEGFHG